MRNIVTVTFAILVLIFGFWFISKVKQPAQKPAEHPARQAQLQEKLPKALCVELTEINHDTFQNQLFMEEPGIQRWPFYLRDGKIVVDKGVAQSIKDGKNVEEYRLFVDKKEIDIEKEAKLFVIHNIVYDGVGRETSFADYYIFSKFPAKIPFPVSDWSSGKVHLTLDDSIGSMLNIRLFQGSDLLLSEAPQNAIEAAYAGTKATISADQEQLLTKNTKPFAITQEAFVPVPKGPITENDIKVETVEYGTIEFSTELKAKNHGLCDVQVE